MKESTTFAVIVTFLFTILICLGITTGYFLGPNGELNRAYEKGIRDSRTKTFDFKTETINGKTDTLFIYIRK
jgi:hypothetical protein